ncbi:MAG TPA: protein TolA [Pseudolabrys sp.]|nr:protein TolA [Pseudolabrys sp.]
MKTASAISAGLHAAVLLWAMVSFSGRPLEATPLESLPVDLVSEKDFSEMTKGAKTAPKAEIPKPLVEKLGDPKPAEVPVPKLTEKKEVTPTAEKTPEPQPQTKPDPIAEKIKKQDEPKQQAKEEPLPPKKPPQKQQPKFDADKIAALLDKRDPQRSAATGEQLNSAPSLGASTGNAAKLSQSELDALRQRLISLWNPPVGIQNPQDFVIRIRIQLGKDRKLSAPPVVLSTGTGTLYNSARDSAVRAVFQAQPFDMLKPEHYETWKDMEMNFDPRDMVRG